MQPYDEVINVLHETFKTHFGNPSSSHRQGRQAKEILERSRQVLAEALGASPEEIYFTSGGTESNNLAITGACMVPGAKAGNIVSSTLEHPSVTKTVRSLKRQGYAVEYVEVKNGILDTDKLAAALSPSTTLITCMSVQNELGYIFPLSHIAGLRDKLAPKALFHTDAVQSFGKIKFTPRETGIDLASISAHKIGGPKGVGALYARKGTRLFSTALGGGQERGLRSGTEAVHQIAAFAKAVEITIENRESGEKAVRSLYNHLEGRLTSTFHNVNVNSRPDGSPYIMSFTLPGTDNKKIMGKLSDIGISIATASACESNHTTVPKGTWRKKHPLMLQLAGISEQAAKSTYRVSFSASNGIDDIDVFIEALKHLAN